MVGRIQGILQRQSNDLRNEKRVRFTRFDAINDADVAKALFTAVEDWAREQGMDSVCGPLGYSDLEREGLLIEVIIKEISIRQVQSSGLPYSSHE